MAWIIPGTLREFSWTERCWWNPDFGDIPDFNAVGLLPPRAHAASGNSYSCENRVRNKWGRSHSPFVHSWKFNCNTDRCSQRLLPTEAVATLSRSIAAPGEGTSLFKSRLWMFLTASSLLKGAASTKWRGKFRFRGRLTSLPVSSQVLNHRGWLFERKTSYCATPAPLLGLLLS